MPRFNKAHYTHLMRRLRCQFICDLVKHRLFNRQQVVSISDMNELVLMAHVLFGVACLITTVWVFVDVLNVSETNQARIRKMSWAAAVFMWLAFLIAGYWYVFFYQADKASS